MSFYMITYGIGYISEAYVGNSIEDVMQRARPMMNGWIEYATLDNEEIIEMLIDDEIAEFDLVAIKSQWQGYDLPMEVMENLYDNFSALPHYQD